MNHKAHVEFFNTVLLLISHLLLNAEYDDELIRQNYCFTTSRLSRKIEITYLVIVTFGHNSDNNVKCAK